VSTSKQSAGRRLRVITIDQAIAGASNVLIAVLAARLLPVASFGLFGIVFLVYVMAQGVSRALVSDPLLVHPLEAQKRTGEVIGTSFVLGLGVAVVVLLAGLTAQFADARLGDALMVLALCMPLLVLQDLGRYLAFATQRPASAVVLDITWLVLLFGAIAALFATNTRTLPWFIAAWGGSGAAAGLLLFWQHSAREVRLRLSWLRHTWSFSWRYLISYVSTQGAALGASSGVGAISGARALGGVQGAALLVRPFMTFQVAAIAATVGEVTRSQEADRGLRRRVALTSALTTAAALVNMLVMLVLSDRLGEVVLGASWHAAQPLLLPTGVQIVCLGLMTGVRAGLLGMRAIRKAMMIDVASTVMVLVAAISGAVIDGATGALWAIALGQGLMTVVWWMTFLTHTSRPEPPASVPLPISLPAVTVATAPPA
jgi:O-antigen/teichoic acid export membrane protein